jgi:HlyD family secretion protein
MSNSPQPNSPTPNVATGSPTQITSSAGLFSRLRKLLIRTLIPLLAIGGVAFVGWLVFQRSFAGQTSDETLVHRVTRTTLDDTVVERGTIESQNTVYGKCELPGYETSITFIVPEGTFVKEGEVIAKLDATKIEQQLAAKRLALTEAEGKLKEAEQNKIAKENDGKGKIVVAERELTLGEIEVKKYVQGDFIAEKAEFERLIADGQATLQKLKDDRANIEVLVKKGYRSPEQLGEYNLRVNSLTKAVERDQQKLENLILYDSDLKKTTFAGKVNDAILKIEREKATATAEVERADIAIKSAQSMVELHKGELKTLEESVAKAEMKAPKDGTVAYANRPWYDASQRIKVGTRLYPQQDIYFLPDMQNMQVKLSLHESVINRVKVDQTASIRLEAFSDRRLKGAISYVSELAASSFSDSKTYDATVLIKEFPSEIALKPGMTAEVEILIGTYEDILAVPVGCVTEHFQQSYVYVQKGREFERRAVNVGRSTHSFIEILEGLAEEEVIATDAYQRGTKEFRAAERKAGSMAPPKEAKKPADSAAGGSE